MEHNLSVEDIPEEYENIKNLLKNVPKDDLPTLRFIELPRTVSVLSNIPITLRSKGSKPFKGLQVCFTNELKTKFDEILKQLVSCIWPRA